MAVGRLLLLLLLAAGCDGAGASQPPPPPVRTAAEYRSERVARAVEAAERSLETRGFARDGEEWRGFLVEQASAMDEAALRSGRCMIAIGAASAEVRELDLRLFDGEGAEVARDAQTGPRAAFHYCPPQSGMYYVVARATAGAGLFAVRRFRGPTGLAVQLDDVFPERP